MTTQQPSRQQRLPLAEEPVGEHAAPARPTDEELAARAVDLEDYEAYLAFLAEGGRDDPPAGADPEDRVPPCLAVLRWGGQETRFLVDPREGGLDASDPRVRVYRLGADDLARLADMGLPERLHHVHSLDLGRLAQLDADLAAEVRGPIQYVLSEG